MYLAITFQRSFSVGHPTHFTLFFCEGILRLPKTYPVWHISEVVSGEPSKLGQDMTFTCLNCLQDLIHL